MTMQIFYGVCAVALYVIAVYEFLKRENDDDDFFNF